MSSIVSRSAVGRLPAPAPDARPPTERLAAASPANTSVAAATPDHALLIAILTLGLFGAVMIASASMAFAEEAYGRPFYVVNRQLIFLFIGLAAGAALLRVPLAVWERYGPHLLILSMVALVLVLVPSIGTKVNGSRRWIDLGLFTVQVSETVKLFIIVYLAGYVVRRGHLVQTTFGGFLRPLLLICTACALLVAEPDYGAAVVIVLTAMTILFVAGVRFSQFLALMVLLGIVGAVLIVLSPYRALRFASFLDPWSDAFGSGFQLTQSLIAVGSGGLTGVGFGSSVQKLFYLPEAHTDFLFAVLCEELGLAGAVALIALYGFIVWRCFRLSRQAELQGHVFASSVALGIGVWVGLQSFINMGVNLGVLPTKGITLPLMSYGGSSAVVFAATFALLLRVEWELAHDASGGRVQPFPTVDVPKARSVGRARPAAGRVLSAEQLAADPGRHRGPRRGR